MTSALHIKVAIGAVALIVGVAGGAASATPETKIKTVEVEKTVEVPVEKIINREVKVEVVPGVCLEALKFGDQVAYSISDITEYYGEFLMAASEFDVRTMTRLNGQMDSMTERVIGHIKDYGSSARRCEAFSKGRGA